VLIAELDSVFPWIWSTVNTPDNDANGMVICIYAYIYLYTINIYTYIYIYIIIIILLLLHYLLLLAFFCHCHWRIKSVFTGQPTRYPARGCAESPIVKYTLTQMYTVCQLRCKSAPAACDRLLCACACECVCVCVLIKYMRVPIKYVPLAAAHIKLRHITVILYIDDDI
jgi:hypothetical protein